MTSKFDSAKTETIFDHNPTEIEIQVINPMNYDKDTYLRSVSAFKILSDLHLLFMIRNDKENSERIMNIIKKDLGK